MRIAGEWFSVGTTVITMTAATLSITANPTSKTTTNPTYSSPSGGEANSNNPNTYQSALMVAAGSVAGNPAWSVVRTGGPTGNRAYLAGSITSPTQSTATLFIQCWQVNVSWSGLPAPENDSPPDYTFTVTLTNNKGRGTCTVTCTHNDPRT